MDGDVADVDAPRRALRASRRAARARRGARGARPGPRRSGPDGAARRHALEDPRRARRLRRRTGRAHRARRQPGPLVHLHHRDLARPTPPPRSPRCGVVRSAEGDALRARLRANIDALRPGHPSPIVPVVCGDEERAVAAARRAARARAARPRDPAPDGAGRHFAAADRARRPRTRSTRCGCCAARSRASASRDDRPAHRHRDRGRQDLVGPRDASTCCAAGGVAVAARKPAQSYAPDELGATDAELLGRASGEPAETVCPRHRWYPVPMAPPMAADVLGLPPFTIAELVAEIAPCRRPARSRSSKARAGRALRSRRRRHASASAARSASTPSCSSRRPGSARSTRSGSRPPRSGGGCAPARLLVALNRYDADDDLHRRNHGWLAGEGFHLVTDPGRARRAR